MQVDKIGSNQAFGAKLKLYGVNRKHWNLSTEEIKKLAAETPDNNAATVDKTTPDGE